MRNDVAIETTTFTKNLEKFHSNDFTTKINQYEREFKNIICRHAHTPHVTSPPHAIRPKKELLEEWQMQCDSQCFQKGAFSSVCKISHHAISNDGKSLTGSTIITIPFSILSCGSHDPFHTHPSSKFTHLSIKIKIKKADPLLHQTHLYPPPGT